MVPLFITLMMLCLGGEVCDFGPGEFIVFKFNGPVTYSYKLKSGEVRTYQVDQEDALLLENKEILKSKQQVYTHLRIVPNGIQIFLGNDKDLKREGAAPEPFYTSSEMAEYLNTALIHNKMKREGPLSPSDPITITGDFIGVQTSRMDFTCKDGSSTDLKVPYKGCLNPYDPKEFTGNLVVTEYSKDDLLTKMAGSQHTMIAGNPQVPLEIVLKNMGPPPIKADATASDPQSTTGTGQATSGKAGGCAFLPPHVPMQPKGALFGVLIWAPALLGLLRFRRAA